VHEKKYVFQGLGYGLLASLVFGLILYGISRLIGTGGENISKLWEAGASFVALLLITTFIYWMIKNRNTIASDIKDKMAIKVTKWGIILLAAVMIAREGAEIAILVFAKSSFAYFIGSMAGVLISTLIVFLIYKALIKVNLKVIFNVTLIYLILQAGFMLGYSVHELLSYLKATEALSGDNILYTKLFDLSDTFLYHKEEIPGMILYATIGWYSKPEVIQFVIQYTYTGILLGFFFKTRK
jgi:high-affinity iron transporter